MDIWMDRWVDIWMDVWMVGLMDGPVLPTPISKFTFSNCQILFYLLIYICL